jgi:hypothetical protein
MRVGPRFAPALLAFLAATLLPAASRVGSAEEQPVEFIKVNQLDSLLARGTRVPIVDVRSRQEYLARHIKGAVSIPLDTIELRAGEIPRQGLVVLY